MKAGLAEKLAQLPNAPGVYFHQDARGEIIYVGKAASLRSRVRHYFQRSRARDAKTEALAAEIADTDWMVAASEAEAVFLEAEMIRRYLPRYNLLLRDDRSLVYVRIDYASDYPTVSLTHQPQDDAARYFGPYLSAWSVRRALTVLRRVFPFATRRPAGAKRPGLSCQLGLDPGLEFGRTRLEDYRANLRRLMAFIGGRRAGLERALEREMRRRAGARDFETAARLRNQLFALRELGRRVSFSETSFPDLAKDHALRELIPLAGLQEVPRRLEACRAGAPGAAITFVVFINGAPARAEYRRFGPPHRRAAGLGAALKRRFRQVGKLPGLVFIEGGPEELRAALAARDECGRSGIPFLGLSDPENQLLIPPPGPDPIAQGETVRAAVTAANAGEFIQARAPVNSNLAKLLRRIREESRRFARAEE